MQYLHLNSKLGKRLTAFFLAAGLAAGGAAAAAGLAGAAALAATGLPLFPISSALSQHSLI